VDHRHFDFITKKITALFRQFRLSTASPAHPAYTDTFLATYFPQVPCCLGTCLDLLPTTSLHTYLTSIFFSFLFFSFLFSFSLVFLCFCVCVCVFFFLNFLFFFVFSFSWVFLGFYEVSPKSTNKRVLGFKSKCFWGHYYIKNLG
jgi:hypothetical protein